MPVSGRYAFLSSGFAPGGTGLQAADEQCQNEATAAMLPGTYKALLATSQTSAVDRFNTNGPTWVRPDGVPVFATANDLTTFTMMAAIAVDAAGNTAINPMQVWAGASSPTKMGGAGCVNWTSSMPGDMGIVGNSGYVFPNGSEFAVTTSPCGNLPMPPPSLYCWEE
jgi:hypothetical protein